MKKIGISGSWRIALEKEAPLKQQVEKDVRDAVREIIARGDAIVSGGAAGVDFWATDEALSMNPRKEQILIIIPTPIDIYLNHCLVWTEEGVLPPEIAEPLKEQILAVKERHVLIEMEHTYCAPDTYFDRNTQVVKHSDELLAFSVNGSPGTQDTIEKAQNQNMPVSIKSYKDYTHKNAIER